MTETDGPLDVRRFGKWSVWGAHRGWICIDIEDLGTPDTPDAVCEMCERQDTVLREGARRLLAQAVEAEAAIGLAIVNQRAIYSTPIHKRHRVEAHVVALPGVGRGRSAAEKRRALRP